AAAALYGTGASFARAQDYPWRPTRDERLANIRRDVPRVGTRDWIVEELRRTYARSLTLDDDYINWFARWVRISASPGAVEQLWLMNTDIDVRRILPSIHVPTLVIHRRDDADFVTGEGRTGAGKV